MAMTVEDAPRPAPAAVSPRAVSVALALLVLVALGPFVAEFSAQTAARYAVAAAVVDDGSIQIDRYEELTFPSDRVEREGHQYGDKAPGQPLLLAAPLYASARLVGAEPATTERIMGNLGVWWITLWSSVAPAAILCALMYQAGRARYGDRAVSAALGLSFGSLLLVFSTQMYGHVLSALLAFAAWLLVRAGPWTPRRLLAAGALAGAAVSVEYTLLLVVVLLAAWLVRVGAGRRLGWFALGGVPFALLLASYQAAAYGSPLRTAYALKPAFDDPTIFGVPDPGTLLETLLGSRGLLVLTPIVALGLWGCWRQLRHPDGPRGDAAMALAVLGGLLVVQAGWPNPWGGEMPGPRYLIPALPFLAVPLARSWKELPLLCRVAAVVGGLVMSLGVLTVHLVAEGRQVVPTYLDYLQDGLRTPTLFTLAVGDAGWVLHIGLVVLALMHLHRVRFLAGSVVADGGAPAVTASP
jgi:hypothetical protein